MSRWVAGVDGCPAGWIAVFRSLNGDQAPTMHLVAEFGMLLNAAPQPEILAVDIPIGLPDLGGRDVEKLVRRHLGERQSSVFTVPSRDAVMCDDYRAACATALATSDPPRKVSKQCFNIFPKIREVDALMTPDLEDRIYEVHPELALWRLNGGAPMALPKKIKSRANPDGITERVQCLRKHGYREDFLNGPRPRGVGADDLIDAAANAVIAERIVAGAAMSFPEAPERDRRGLRMAIWA